MVQPYETNPLIDNPEPLLRELRPEWTDDDVREAVQHTYEDILDEDPEAATFLMKVTYNAAPGRGSCTLWCITYLIGSASEGNFDIERADLYTDRQAAEQAWNAYCRAPDNNR